MRSGTVSEDFPLFHSKYIPTFKKPNEKQYTHKRAKINNIYTNEHPDIFRLDEMKEGGYNNPFLNNIIKVDRSEFYKKLSLDRKNINFIDFIKTNRNYSQNQKVIRYISNDEDIELRRKRMKEKNKNLSYSKMDSNYNDYIFKTEENKNRKEYYNLIKTLNSFVPKIDYRIKKTLKISVEGNKDNNKDNDNNNDNINTEIENNNLYKKITNKNLKYINNLRNINNFKINKSVNRSEGEFSFQRKEINQYNPMRDRKELIAPPPYINEKWSPFLENYFLMANTDKKFQRKGGLLTEFCNKNIVSINNDKKLIQQKLKKK